MTVPDSLDEFARTDLMLDALAQRRPVDVEDPDADVLTTLLEDWRDNLRWPPASALVTPEEAVNALRTGLAEQRRGHRGLTVVGSVAAALMVLSGFGAMVVEARPGGTLYGLHAMFFDQPQVHEKQEMLAAKADLAKVQESIDRGQWDQAKNQLTEVSSLVQSIDDPASKQELTNQLKLLNAKVDARDPNATLPVASPPAAPAGPASAIPAAPPAPLTPPAVAPSPTPSPSVGKHHHHGHTPPPVAPLPANQ
ncbi:MULTISPECIES: anti-sigma-D factor RsdA [Mycobacterium]|uniref:anti-sigma-D factor RsdA n=1 Tax=Mycobacterium TaxID=1763 RepID=UPI0023E87DD5|nr:MULTISPECIES: anti-sigma-D factor RsdA [Mycobacterium]MDM4141673.1 anti-sigma-D factor RsdA [Mycobacterium sp. FLAC0960]